MHAFSNSLIDKQMRIIDRRFLIKEREYNIEDSSKSCKVKVISLMSYVTYQTRFLFILFYLTNQTRFLCFKIEKWQMQKKKKKFEKWHFLPIDKWLMIFIQPFILW